MIYPCTVKDSKGKVKKKYTKKQLSKKYWKDFELKYKFGTPNKKSPIAPISLINFKEDSDPNFYLP